jgi:Uncharacterized protein conserved in bacteria
MVKEIERKFLVVSDSWRDHVISTTPMRQAYMATGRDRSVRIRIKNDKSARLTIKIGKSAVVRDEFEYDIPLTDAEEMMELAIGNVIEKVRHTVQVGNFLWEIDVFQGAYSGLVTAEVEMKSEADKPLLPTWIGREVTGDQRYSNQALATEHMKPELVHAVQN